MSTSPTFPTPYVPRPVPTIDGGDAVYLQRELRALQVSVQSLIFMSPQNASLPPDRPRSGMIRRAVSPWRPVAGQTTDRWVSYDGSAWGYLT